MKPEMLIYRLRLRGYSLARIAQEVGATRQYVYKVIHEHGEQKETKANKVRQRIQEILNG